MKIRLDKEFLKTYDRQFQKGKALGLEGRAAPQTPAEIKELELEVDKPIPSKFRDNNSATADKYGSSNGSAINLSEYLNAIRLDIINEFPTRTFLNVDRNLTPEVIAFRVGYMGGIEDFVGKHKLTFSRFSFARLDPFSATSSGVPGLDSLLTSEGFEYFSRGIRLEAPETYLMDLSSMKEKLTGVPLWQVHSSDVLGAQNSYKLGLTVAISRDFGVAVNPDRLPFFFDNASYHAMMEGIRAKPRADPSGFGSKALKYYSHYLGDNESMYTLGLELWLTKKGVSYFVKVEDIREPTALDAFKAALEGKVLQQYEPAKPKTYDAEIMPRTGSKFLPDEFKKKEESKLLYYLEKKHHDICDPSAAFEAQRVQAGAQEAYDLGKKMHVFKSFSR